jgi:hypothetical protein
VRKPRLTRKVLDGLTAAMGTLQVELETAADNYEPVDFDQYETANRWLMAMWAWRNQKEQQR